MKTIPTVSRIVGAFTVQANNIMQIDKVIEYFMENMDIIFYSHRVQYPRGVISTMYSARSKTKSYC